MPSPSALDQVTVVCLQFIFTSAVWAPCDRLLWKVGHVYKRGCSVIIFFNLQVLLVSSELLIIAFTRWTDVYVFVFEEKS